MKNMTIFKKEKSLKMRTSLGEDFEVAVNEVIKNISEGKFKIS
jgi:hypothetical protein